MDRSLYPEGVELRQADLENTESTRAFHILRRFIDMNTGGVIIGLSVTTNLVNTSTVDIAAGTGYAPGGEYIELLGSITETALADDTNGVRNFVLLVYTETNDGLRPHETIPGDSRATKANRSIRVEVLTETAFNLLPQTDTNLDNTDLDRSLIAAIITAPGSGITISANNITSPTQFTGGVTAVKTTSNISGVSILSISPDTTIGVGTLNFTLAGGILIWIAPGDTTGTPVVIGAGGVFTLTSSPSLTTIRVSVQDTLLPGSDQVDQVSVTNIYTQETPSASAEDAQHRSLVGSGIPTATNPHGLTPGDLGLGETQTESHQEVFHSTGITADSSAATLNPVVNTGGIPHSLAITALVSGDKVVAGGFIHTSTNGTVYTMLDIVDNVQALFQYFVVTGAGSGVATLEKRERVRFDDAPPPQLTLVVQLADASPNIGAGSGEIEYLASGLRFKAPGDGSFGADVLIPLDADNPIPRFVRLHNVDGTKFIDLFIEDNSGGAWGGIAFVVEAITFSTPLTFGETTDRALLANTPFSGSSTGFLGFGFGASSAPNAVIDKRQFGNTGTKDLQSILYETVLGRFPVRQNGAHIQLVPTEVFPESLGRNLIAPNKSPDDGTMLMYQIPATGLLFFFIWKNTFWDFIG